VILFYYAINIITIYFCILFVSSLSCTFFCVYRYLANAEQFRMVICVPVVGQRICGACLRSMVQSPMSIFRLITIPENIVVLHTYNILKTQVAVLVVVLLSYCSGIEMLFFTNFNVM